MSTTSIDLDRIKAAAQNVSSSPAQYTRPFTPEDVLRFLRHVTPAAVQALVERLQRAEMERDALLLRVAPGKPQFLSVGYSLAPDPDDPLDDVLPLPATDPRPIAEAVLYNFDQVERFDDKRRGVVFVVDNPVECHDFNHLFGTEVIINSALWKVKGVERFAHCAPWRKGEKIGLQVEPVPAQPIDNFYSGQLGKPRTPDLPDSEGGHHD